MSLTYNQKLRLEQLEIPRWVSRNISEKIVEDDERIEVNTLLEDKMIHCSKGDNPTIFWIVKDKKFDLPEKFINDVSLSIKGEAVSWQVLSGDISLIKSSITNTLSAAIFIVLENSLNTVELTIDKQSISIQLPIEICEKLSLKRLLWNQIRNHFHG